MQTLRDIEIILVDDGSTDSTLAIINSFKVDKRIIVLTQENQKQGAARNAGLKVAKGEFVGFVDADDYVDFDFFEKLYNLACQENVDIVAAKMLKHKKNFNRYNVFYQRNEYAEALTEKIDLCKDKSQRFFYVINKIYRKSFLFDKQIFFPENCYFEDVMFSAQAIFCARKIVSCSNTTYHYIEHSSSTVKSKSNIQKKKNDHNNAYNELQEFCKTNNIDLPERLNYTESYWLNPFLKIYKGSYKTKYLFLGFIPCFVRKK